jgi:hypothetical protein
VMQVCLAAPFSRANHKAASARLCLDRICASWCAKSSIDARRRSGGDRSPPCSLARCALAR